MKFEVSAVSNGPYSCPSAPEVGPSEGPAAGRPGRLQQDVRGDEEDRPGRHGEAGPVQGGGRRAAPR